MNEHIIAIYSRKSKFTGKGESIENQIELCRQYIAGHLPDADLEQILVYEDEGFSGGDLERPKFKAMMAYNRTLQKNGKANQIRPISEWIVSVGKHTGLICGSDWVRVMQRANRFILIYAP